MREDDNVILFLFQYVSSQLIIPMTNPNLKYVGRWQNTKQGKQMAWPGGYIQTRLYTN
ncbi:unnamed protein product [Cunninghamella blakesleeana]